MSNYFRIALLTTALMLPLSWSAVAQTPGSTSAAAPQVAPVQSPDEQPAADETNPDEDTTPKKKKHQHARRAAGGHASRRIKEGGGGIGGRTKFGKGAFKGKYKAPPHPTDCNVDLC